VKLAWSNLANAELRELRRYSVDRWGSNVADRYLEDIRSAVKPLSVDPLGARPLKGPFRILRVRSHDLIVHVDTAADLLTIARVPHVAIDIGRPLP
jgi:plasmid stabilization system protein ParE